MPETPNRELPPPREPMQPRAIPTASRVVGTGGIDTSTFERMSQRSIAGRAIEVYDVLPNIPQGNVDFARQPLSPTTPDTPVTSGVTSNGNIVAPPQYLYDPSTAFGLAGDLFSRFYSNAPVESPQSPVVVGDTGFSQGKSSNAGLFLVVIILGIGGYFLYRRMKNG